MGINLKNWAFFSDVERRKIEETLGITLADYTTTDEREAVLMEFDLETQRQAEIQGRKEIIDHFFERQERTLALPATLEMKVLSPVPQYLPAPVTVLPAPPPPYFPEIRQPVIRPQPEVISLPPVLALGDSGRMAGAREKREIPEPEHVYSLLGSIKRYALVTAFTLGGAYLGFSAARHTYLADELRSMEENPLIRAYQAAHEVETYQRWRELDFLGPEQEKVAERREILNSAKKKIGKVRRVINTITTLVKDVPLLGRGAALIERQRQQIQLYEQKQEQYSSNLIKYTTAGAGGGFGLGVFLAFSLGRMRKTYHER